METDSTVTSTTDTINTFVSSDPKPLAAVAILICGVATLGYQYIQYKKRKHVGCQKPKFHGNLENQGNEDASTTIGMQTQHLLNTSAIEKQLNMHKNAITNMNINMVSEAKSSQAKRISIIPAASTSFTGREEQLARIAELLDQGQMVAVCGLAGIGKSELARQYAHNNSDKYRHLLWVEAETEISLNQFFRDLANLLSIKTEANTNIKYIIRSIYATLIQEDKQTILIFDNALHRRAINVYLLPASHKKIHVMLTSQSTQWGGGVYPLLLQPIGEDAAMELFRNVLRDVDDQLNIESNVVHLQQLARHLSYMPLALQIAACYLRQEADGMNSHFSVSDYVQKLTKSDKLLNKQFTEDSDQLYQNSIYNSLKMTLDRIEETAEDADTVLHVVYVCAYLNADGIEDYKLKMVPKEELRSALRTLKSYSLISVEHIKKSWEPDHCIRISMHRLVQQVLRFHQKRCGTVARHLAAAVHVAIANIHSGHLQSVLEYAEQHVDIVRQCSQDSESFQRFIKEDGGTWLLGSALRGYSQLVEFLLQDSGVLANTQEEDGSTPLHLVAECDDADQALKCARLLVQHGASVNAKDSLGRTPLHWAATGGRWQLVRLYVEENSYPNARGKDGRTPLHWIAWCKDEEEALRCARVLVQLGASLHASDKLGRTPLCLARQRCMPRLVRLLEELEGDVSLLSTQEK